MKTRLGPSGVLTGFAVVAVACTGYAVGQKMPEADRGPSVAPTFLLGNQTDYAGIARCRSCHKAEYREYEKTRTRRSAFRTKITFQGVKSATGPARAQRMPLRRLKGMEGKTPGGTCNELWLHVILRPFMTASQVQPSSPAASSNPIPPQTRATPANWAALSRTTPEKPLSPTSSRFPAAQQYQSS